MSSSNLFIISLNLFLFQLVADLEPLCSPLFSFLIRFLITCIVLVNPFCPFLYILRSFPSCHFKFSVSCFVEGCLVTIYFSSVRLFLAQGRCVATLFFVYLGRRFATIFFIYLGRRFATICFSFLRIFLVQGRCIVNAVFLALGRCFGTIYFSFSGIFLIRLFPTMCTSAFVLFQFLTDILRSNTFFLLLFIL